MKLITLVRKWLSNQAVVFWVGYTAGVIAVKTEYWWDLFHSSVILVLVFSGLLRIVQESA